LGIDYIPTKLYHLLQDTETPFLDAEKHPKRYVGWWLTHGRTKRENHKIKLLVLREMGRETGKFDDTSVSNSYYFS
jgi:hypothetical protein